MYMYLKRLVVSEGVCGGGVRVCVGGGTCMWEGSGHVLNVYVLIIAYKQF